MNHHNTTEWDGFTDGGNVGNWIFKSVALDNQTDQPLWVSVYGPVGKYSAWRSFTLDRLRPLTSRAAKRRAQSTARAAALLAEAKIKSIPPPKGEAKLIRAWASENDIELNAMGRIPVEIRDRYIKATA
jgi:hypothetical protein